jgi:hypothetical protein
MLMITNRCLLSACTHFRDCCRADALRHSAGQEWEGRLNADLAAAGVAFWTEEQLRAKGYHKTPDARLQVRHAALALAWVVSW